MTPQIITETVWALACDPANSEKWIPEEVHVISTEHGHNQIRDRLINKGIFQKLIADYHLPPIKFDDGTMHSINGASGSPLEDLKSPEDNERAADAICAKVREFTERSAVNLHVSIAGGRKTMGFYAGYALSLYGRYQDRMSHVLVEEQYERAINFFYPSPDKKEFSVDREQRVIGPSNQAKIWLANIPFVRLRNSLPEKSLVSNASFSDIVETINIANQPIQITLNYAKRTLTVGQKTIKLPPREYAFYQWFAELAVQNAESVPSLVDGEKRDIPRLLELWKRAKYSDLVDPANEDSVKFDQAFFDQILSRTNKKLINHFGKDIANLISVKNKNGRGSGYALALQPDQIAII